MAGIVRRDPGAPGFVICPYRFATADHAHRRRCLTSLGHQSTQGVPLKSDLIALILASLPVLAFVALIVETIRTGTGTRDYPPAGLLYRAYGA